MFCVFFRLIYVYCILHVFIYKCWIHVWVDMTFVRSKGYWVPGILTGPWMRSILSRRSKVWRIWISPNGKVLSFQKSFFSASVRKIWFFSTRNLSFPLFLKQKKSKTFEILFIFIESCLFMGFQSPIHQIFLWTLKYKSLKSLANLLVKLKTSNWLVKN